MAIDNSCSTPLLSICIPTRNRAAYASVAIRCLLSHPSDQFELVVVDNSDSDELGNLISDLRTDSRLNYRYTRPRIAGVDNCNAAIDGARGRYVTLLGDDDGINPELVDAVAWAEPQDLDALVATRPAQYHWPDVRFHLYGNRISGQLHLAPFTGQRTYPDPQQEIFKCARSGGQDFCDLPKVYYGVVRRTCLQQLKERMGAYFLVSPDMSSAIGLANFVHKMCKIDYPLFLPGTCAKSTAGMGARKEHRGRLEDQAHLPQSCIDQWSPYVPKFFSGITIWGEACVQALMACGRDDVLKQFNFPRLHAMAVTFEPAWHRLTLANFFRTTRRSQRNVCLASGQLALHYAGTWVQRGRSLVRNLTRGSNASGVQTINDVMDIQAATNHVADWLDDLDMSLAKTLSESKSTSPNSGTRATAAARNAAA